MPTFISFVLVVMMGTVTVMVQDNFYGSWLKKYERDLSKGRSNYSGGKMSGIRNRGSYRGRSDYSGRRMSKIRNKESHRGRSDYSDER